MLDSEPYSVNHGFLSGTVDNTNTTGYNMWELLTLWRLTTPIWAVPHR